MATYVIGDVQGCYDSLLALFECIAFRPKRDRAWFLGDLVNRGPKSLEVLRFIHQLPEAVTVLGNHDLSLLSVAYCDIQLEQHTLSAILQAPDREQLLSWLLQQPLLLDVPTFNCVLVHAGIPPQWSLTEAKKQASNVESILRGPHFSELLIHMFGNQPNDWSDALTHQEKIRFTINALTRMRLCDREGRLELSYKGALQEAPDYLVPWYKLTRLPNDKKIIFGHWAALKGKTDSPYVEALDTGCYWGGQLTALRLDDWRRFTVDCKECKGSPTTS